MLNNYVTIIPESYVPMINMQLNVTMLQLQLDPESKKLLPLKLQRIYYNITGIPHSSCTDVLASALNKSHNIQHEVQGDMH